MDIRNLDPRVVQEIQRNPYMLAEQGPAFQSQADAYIALSRLPQDESLIWGYIQGGTSDLDQLLLQTGLSPEGLSKGLISLRGKGLVVIDADTNSVYPTVY